mmetsp:Transcript_11800/g.37446  ORF Transcript_11800/g.37446 Transcript_11800/m.37446 type:complete len:260 (+) Transcript_11800:51-830(+)
MSVVVYFWQKKWRGVLSDAFLTSTRTPSTSSSASRMRSFLAADALHAMWRAVSPDSSFRFTSADDMADSSNRTHSKSPLLTAKPRAVWPVLSKTVKGDAPMVPSTGPVPRRSRMAADSAVYLPVAAASSTKVCRELAAAALAAADAVAPRMDALEYERERRGDRDGGRAIALAASVWASASDSAPEVVEEPPTTADGSMEASQPRGDDDSPTDPPPSPSGACSDGTPPSSLELVIALSGPTLATAISLHFSIIPSAHLR